MVTVTKPHIWCIGRRMLIRKVTVNRKHFAVVRTGSEVTDKRRNKRQIRSIRRKNSWKMINISSVMTYI